ncbi:unnamed protein product [Pleuronectes platessa]|uniref:Uncharacterized protein n=1 Tax=Pleuronectes platessa TaxID=8262 RepID=A0A9N7VBK5_PLEPL|nr:unnamed protein product [Pleuronectes platessa]
MADVSSIPFTIQRVGPRSDFLEPLEGCEGHFSASSIAEPRAAHLLLLPSAVIDVVRSVPEWRSALASRLFLPTSFLTSSQQLQTHCQASQIISRLSCGMPRPYGADRPFVPFTLVACLQLHQRPLGVNSLPASCLGSKGTPLSTPASCSPLRKELHLARPPA